MKAYELQQFGIDGLTLVEKPDPQPGARQVIVQVRAVSLNYRDLMVVKGQYNPRLKLPIIPFSDGAGEIVAVGSEVKSFKPGDRVAGTFFQNWTGGEPNEAKARTAKGGGDGLGGGCELSGGLAHGLCRTGAARGVAAGRDAFGSWRCRWCRDGGGRSRTLARRDGDRDGRYG